MAHAVSWLGQQKPPQPSASTVTCQSTSVAFGIFVNLPLLLVVYDRQENRACAACAPILHRLHRHSPTLTRSWGSRFQSYSCCCLYPPTRWLCRWNYFLGFVRQPSVCLGGALGGG